MLRFNALTFENACAGFSYWAFSVKLSGQIEFAKLMKVATWIKRLGFWGFLFFLVKGLIWLLVPALAFYFAN